MYIENENEDIACFWLWPRNVMNYVDRRVSLRVYYFVLYNLEDIVWFVISDVEYQ